MSWFSPGDITGKKRGLKTVDVKNSRCFSTLDHPLLSFLFSRCVFSFLLSAFQLKGTRPTDLWLSWWQMGKQRQQIYLVRMKQRKSAEQARANHVSKAQRSAASSSFSSIEVLFSERDL